MKKITTLSLTSFTIFFTSCINSNQADYKFIGQYEYEITNDSLFNNTYLTEDSYRYVIGDLEVQGLKIKNIDKLDKTQDYIISINNPLEAVYTDSKRINDEGIKTKLKPLDIIKNKKIKTKTIYIYQLEQKNKYRLLFG